MRGANTQANFHRDGADSTTSQQSFNQKRLRVQSAVNTRGREVNAAKKEKENMIEEERRYQAELNDIKLRNDELR